MFALETGGAAIKLKTATSASLPQTHTFNWSPVRTD